ncbi:MAG TPA: peroxiredoxin [Rariglobus sp.]|jgi:peroxiredoxin Q/BCP|nr:peroxiredoxin [Rariglobus sp.]
MKRLLLIPVLFAMTTLLHAAPLNVGDPAPAVTGTTETGADLNLADAYKRQPYTLVYFYPKAFTGGCTAQGCSLRDAYEKLTKKGVAVIGVSTDSAETQKKFKDAEKFPFTLIADTDKKVMKAFGQNGVMFASRQAYLIHDGKIVYADHKGSTTKQAQDILDFLAKNGG